MAKPVPTREETRHLEAFESLPAERIFVPRTPEEFKAAAAEILAQPLVGFDTESKPLFSHGQVSDGPHVVQFALADRAYLFQTQRSDGLPFLVALLQAQSVLKAGFELKSDKGQIRARLGVEPQGILELNDVFRKAGYGPSTGIRGAVALMFGRRFIKSKKITTSNWAATELSPRQQAYAANDAWGALRVAKALGLPLGEAEHHRVAGES